MKTQHHQDRYQPSQWIQDLEDFLVPPPKFDRPYLLNAYQQGEQTTGDGINYKCIELTFLWPAKIEENLMYYWNNNLHNATKSFNKPSSFYKCWKLISKSSFSLAAGFSLLYNNSLQDFNWSKLNYTLNWIFTFSLGHFVHSLDYLSNNIFPYNYIQLYLTGLDSVHSNTLRDPLQIPSGPITRAMTKRFKKYNK